LQKDSSNIVAAATESPESQITTINMVEHIHTYTHTHTYVVSEKKLQPYAFHNKKLSCRRETTRCLVSLNISLRHSKSFEMAFLRKA